MLPTRRIMEMLTGHHTVEMFIEWMIQEHEDFAADYQRYTYAIRALRRELGVVVDDEIDAIEQQCASNLLFSCSLGLKANLDNFIDPITRNFMDVDFEVYLREEIAHRLPNYEQAQQARERFRSQLTLEQKEIYNDVILYTNHLETVGPKLAHYFGYMLGNQLLSWIVPGYHEDSILTMRYTDMLNSFFGRPILSSTM